MSHKFPKLQICHHNGFLRKSQWLNQLGHFQKIPQFSQTKLALTLACTILFLQVSHLSQKLHRNPSTFPKGPKVPTHFPHGNLWDFPVGQIMFYYQPNANSFYTKYMQPSAITTRLLLNTMIQWLESERRNNGGTYAQNITSTFLSILHPINCSRHCTQWSNVADPACLFVSHKMATIIGRASQVTVDRCCVLDGLINELVVAC